MTWLSRKQASLNKLSLDGTLWLASDIHLGEHIPRTRQAFYAFLDSARAHANALVLAGDIFDFWAGDDIALKSSEPWLQEALDQLKKTATHIPLYLMHGNRDFLIRHKLAKQINATLLADTVIIESAAGPIRLSHGDEYCTDDPAYQRFRKIVHNPLIQATFLALPRRLRHRLASHIRSQSKNSHAFKNDTMVDVSSSAIKQAFLENTQVRTLIHGHTHMPGHHTLMLHGALYERWVLPDWEYDHEPVRGGYIEIKKSGVCLHRFDLPANAQSVAN